MRQIKLDTTLYDVPLTVVGFDYSLSRTRPPSGNDVEMEDVEVGGVSIYAVLDPEVRRPASQDRRRPLVCRRRGSSRRAEGRSSGWQIETTDFQQTR